jgi:hypothetical protein
MSGIVVLGLVVATFTVLQSCRAGWTATDANAPRSAVDPSGRAESGAELAADVESSLVRGLLAGHLDSDLYRDAMADLAGRPTQAAHAYRARGGFVSG